MADADHLDQCYWHQCEDGTLALIPRCWGCAVNGPEQCTCDIPGSRIEQMEAARRSAEAEILRLRDKLMIAQDHQADRWHRMKQLSARVRELETANG